eukprot:PhF_6_TR31162/c0_g1_i1/m.45679
MKPIRLSVKVLSGLQVVFIFVVSLSLTGYLTWAATETMSSVAPVTLSRTLEYVRLNVSYELRGPANCLRIVHFVQVHRPLSILENQSNQLLYDLKNCFEVMGSLREVYAMEYFKSNSTHKNLTHTSCHLIPDPSTGEDTSEMVCEKIVGKDMFELEDSIWVNVTDKRQDYIQLNGEDAEFVRFALKLTEYDNIAMETDRWLNISLLMTVVGHFISPDHHMFYFADLPLSNLVDVLDRKRLSPDDYFILYNNTWGIVAAAVPAGDMSVEPTENGDKTDNVNVNLITQEILKKISSNNNNNNTFAISLKDEIFLGCFDVLDLLITEHSELTWYLTLVIPERIMTEGIQETRFQAFVLSGIVTFFVVFLSIALAKSIVSPLESITQVLHRASELKFKQPTPETWLSEMGTLASDVAVLLRRLNEFKKFFPTDMVPPEEQNDDEDDEEGTCVVAVHLTRVSRLDRKKKTTVNFSFQYNVSSKNLFQKLLSTCRQRVNLNVGELVDLYYFHSGEWVPLADEAGFVQALVSNPDVIILRISRKPEKSLFPLWSTLLSFSTTAMISIFAQLLLRTGSSGVAGLIVCCQCAQLVLNFTRCLTIYRGKQFKEYAMEEWMRNRATEAAIGLLVGTFHVENLHILNCNYRYRDIIAFQAPLTSSVRALIDSSAAPGAFCGDFVPFLVTLYVIVVEGGARVFSIPISVAVLSFIHLVQFVSRRTHIIVLAQSALVKTVDVNLVEKEVTFMLCSKSDFSDVLFLGNQSSLADSCAEYYDVVFNAIRSHTGVVSHFSGGDVHVVFNATHPVVSHKGTGVKCAQEIVSKYPAVICTLVSQKMKVGNLGVSNHRSFQHLGSEFFWCRTLAAIARRQLKRNAVLATGDGMISHLKDCTSPGNLHSSFVAFRGLKIEFVEILENENEVCNPLTYDFCDIDPKQSTAHEVEVEMVARQPDRIICNPTKPIQIRRSEKIPKQRDESVVLPQPTEQSLVVLDQPFLRRTTYL